MSKIIGVTVGTPTSPGRIKEEIKPVLSVNNKTPDENGNVEVPGGNGGINFTTDKSLNLDPETGVLSVNTAKQVEKDNTLPITSAAVHTVVGNIEALLKTI